MPRSHSSVLTQLQQLPSWLSQDFKIDMGSSLTRVVVGQKLVWHQPTCLAVDRRSGSVVEIGQQALSLMGKTPPHITLIFPVQNGRIAEVGYAEKYLQTVVKLVLTQLQRPLVVYLRADAAISVSLSPIERSMWNRVLHSAGFQSVKLVPKPRALLAHMISTKTAKSHFDNVLFIDIGAQTTELAVFVQNQIIKAETLTIGSHTFTQAIEDAIRLDYQALVSWPMAEKIKLQQRNLQLIPSDKPAATSHKTSLRVTDALTRTPKTIYIERTAIEIVLRVVAEQLAKQITIFLSQLPPESLTAVMEQTAVVSGGGSLLPGLVEYLESRLQLSIMPAEQPELAVIWGVVAPTT